MRPTTSKNICLIGEFGESRFLRVQVLEIIHQENLATTLSPVPHCSISVVEGAVLNSAHMNSDIDLIML